VNVFESGQKKVIPAVLIYAFSGEKVLLIHKSDPKRAKDGHAGKWNGLGGKLEFLESPRNAASREFEEEAGVSIPADRFFALGHLSFPNFKPHKNEDWSVHLFGVELSPGEAGQVCSTDEGENHWIPLSEALDRPFWDGDRLFLPSILDRKPVFGTFWYEGGVLSRHELYRL
jgi:8-oxo-dGTP diphosphatase